MDMSAIRIKLLLFSMWLSILKKEFQQRSLILFWALDHSILAVLTLGKCKPYEMISSALWSMELGGRMLGKVLRPVVDGVLHMFTGPHHCRNSYEWQKHLYELELEHK